jgi:hypothetical protein
MNWKSHWTFPRLVRGSGLAALAFLILWKVQELERRPDTSIFEVAWPLAGVVLLVWSSATALFWVATRMARKINAKRSWDHSPPRRTQRRQLTPRPNRDQRAIVISEQPPKERPRPQCVAPRAAQ